MIRSILGLKIQNHVNMKKVREKFRFMSVNQLCIYHTLLEAYSIMKKTASEQIQTKWTNIHRNYLLRSSTGKELKVPDKPRNNCTGFSYHAPKLFNMIPKTFRETLNPSKFKTLIKEWIWKEIPSY